ncbi:MAG: hypothetical protein AAF806_01510 [Bacteroidota bacterium]
MKWLIFSIIFVCACTSSQEVATSQETTNNYLAERLKCNPNNFEVKPICLVCRKDDQLIPYVYGRLSQGKIERYGQINVDFIAAGCIMDSCYPKWFCKRDSVDVFGLL